MIKLDFYILHLCFKYLIISKKFICIKTKNKEENLEPDVLMNNKMLRYY